jgi:hypothetical protein
MREIWVWAGETLGGFRSCFSRSRAFRIFLAIAMAAITRQDDLGLASLIRAVSACPGFHMRALAFMSASSWSPGAIWMKRAPIAGKSGLLLEDGMGRARLAADASKRRKESRRAPRSFSRNPGIPRSQVA